ncbi:MAG TPA: hypothetical protein DDZ51_13905 [Planctomycetaceae bacterium]|nr:hypothetical protein [Planctomycetaceae bacterium]
MTNSQRLSSVRSALRQWISERQPDATDLHEAASEAMLIRDGFFCGRRFRFENYQAVWFLEEDEVKIRDTDGNVLAMLRSNEIDQLAQVWETTPVTQPSSDEEVRTLSIAAHLENKASESERRRAA